MSIIVTVIIVYCRAGTDPSLKEVLTEADDTNKHNNGATLTYLQTTERDRH